MDVATEEALDRKHLSKAVQAHHEMQERILAAHRQRALPEVFIAIVRSGAHVRNSITHESNHNLLRRCVIE